MPKTKNSTEKPFSLDWKSLWIGIVAGALLLTLIIAAGGRIEKWDFGIVEMVFPTPTSNVVYNSSTQGILKLEDLPFTAFSYGFGNDFIAPQHFNHLTVFNRANSVRDYKLDFSIPQQGDAAAGIAFALSEPLDLTDYSEIQLQARFTNSQCDLYMEDASEAGAFVTISDMPPASLQPTFANGKWQLKISLTYYDSINRRAIREVGCNAWRCEGQCQFELSAIQFSKP